tara:strand:- start:34 stop:240 length:207 start_codon:yes stop_codon:yes gene_type:complete
VHAHVREHEGGIEVALALALALRRPRVEFCKNVHCGGVHSEHPPCQRLAASGSLLLHRWLHSEPTDSV